MMWVLYYIVIGYDIWNILLYCCWLWWKYYSVVGGVAGVIYYIVIGYDVWNIFVMLLVLFSVMGDLLDLLELLVLESLVMFWMHFGIIGLCFWCIFPLLVLLVFGPGGCWCCWLWLQSSGLFDVILVCCFFWSWRYLCNVGIIGGAGGAGVVGVMFWIQFYVLDAFLVLCFLVLVVLECVVYPVG